MSLNIEKQELLTWNYLKSILHYDSETGIWTWLIHPYRSNIQIGDRAGYSNLDIDKYNQIKINKIRYSSSRLAWFYMTGEWPINEIDHKNEIKTDDRWDNLRLATHSENIKYTYENGRKPKIGWKQALFKYQGMDLF